MTLWKPIVALAALLLAACAQDLGGITKVDAEFTPEGLPVFEYESGKEAGAINLVFTRSGEDIQVEVTAGDVEAFEGQAIQAERIKAQTDAITGTLREVLPDVLKAALCAAGLVTSC